MGATSALFNGLFKMVWGTLLDYFPFRKVYGFIIVTEIIMIPLIQVAVYNKYLFMLVSWITFMCDGCLTSMLPAVVIEQFGIERGPEVYSLMYSNMGLSSVASVATF